MKKRYWLRGGIIFTIIVIVWLVIGIYYITPQLCTPTLNTECFRMATFPMNLLIGLFPVIVYSAMAFGFSEFGMFVIAGVFYFIIGAIFGWIYGKFSTRGGSAFGGKNRNKVI